MSDQTNAVHSMDTNDLNFLNFLNFFFISNYILMSQHFVIFPTNSPIPPIAFKSIYFQPGFDDYDIIFLNE